MKSDLSKLLLCIFILVSISCTRNAMKSPRQVVLKFSLKLDPNVYKQSHYKKPPQFAVWIEEVRGGEIRTVWVTDKTGTGSWGGNTTRAVSLPYWVSRWDLETQSSSFPTPENPVVDAVTGATPKDDLAVEIVVPAKSVWNYFVESNVSGDYNDAFPTARKDGTRDMNGNGQPSIVYRGKIAASPGRQSTPQLIGRTDQLKDVKDIIPDLEGITSAKDVFSEIQVSCELQQ